MTNVSRDDWSHHIDQILRSKHYTWIAEGLGGAPLRQALVSITADVMHMCHRSGVTWEQLVSESERLCEREESEFRPTSHAA
ncbi:MAG TPA: hypothetical protein VK137_05410 [Planctomycetaceae bacterium]|nr:hypothetical protein [Planctomycetaceae bacterium]